MAVDISSLRNEYTRSSLDVDSVEDSPIDQFGKWFEESQKLEILEPNAMILATSDSKGRVTQRTVLLKAFDDNGFVFFTNYGSEKANQISQNPHVSLLFQWLPLERQIIITGTVTKTSRTESEVYFKSRPYNSQLGAWASQQSQEVPSREYLENLISKLKLTYPEGEVPLPDFWGGYRVAPLSMEFWQGRPSRLHDRIMYSKSGNTWTTKRLSP
ncbi:MAG: pyridoxamine 5'-phosphate oxidase [Cyclobacteriaceae bacterium]